MNHIMIDSEVWATVPDCNGRYEISSFGEVRKGKKIMKAQRMSNGYLFYALSLSVGRKFLSAHRLVAKAFIPNPANKPQVNHIDGNRVNNCVSNLEWVTVSENHLHAFRHLGRKNPPRPTGINAFNIRPVMRRSETNEVQCYPSIKAAKLDGFPDHKAILAVCKTIKRSYKNNTWKYITKNDYIKWKKA